MMWAKRAAAVVAAGVLIVAAILIRDNVIEGDDEPRRGDATLVCLAELAALCTAAGVDFRTASLDTVTAEWSARDADPDEVWFTVAPFPDVVELRRTSSRLEPLAVTTRTVASSPLALVVPTTKAAALDQACPGLTWRCLGDVAGRAWDDLGASGGTVRPAFAPTDTALGRLSIGAAVGGYFANATIDASDTGFLTWRRTLQRVMSGVQLSARTPIATMLTRPSALDVAVGAEAELDNSRREAFGVLYAAPMTRVDLVLAAPGGVTVPDDALSALRQAALDAGWVAQAPGSPPDASALVAAVEAWGRR